MIFLYQQRAKRVVFEFTAVQAAQKAHVELVGINAGFTAVQAAQKLPRILSANNDKFTAVQADKMRKKTRTFVRALL